MGAHVSAPFPEHLTHPHQTVSERASPHRSYVEHINSIAHMGMLLTARKHAGRIMAEYRELRCIDWPQHHRHEFAWQHFLAVADMPVASREM